jgi:hypothetical protein
MSETTEVAVRHSRVPATIRAMRPRQWVKNLLVLAAPLAAGRLFEPAVLKDAALAFVAFCLVSATVYLVNDVRDVDEDRQHPTKRFRPIAAGELKPASALAVAAVLGIGGIALGFFVSVPLGITVVVYVALQLPYSLWAFENRGEGTFGVPWTAISIAPFTLALLQYALEVDAGTAGEPEEVVLNDRVLQGLGLVWLAVISIAVFF